MTTPGSVWLAPLCVSLLVASLATSASTTPGDDIIRPADVRPDRGDVPGGPHITGPTTPIHSFYNGDLEISFWNGPADMTFSLAKNDVWDRRYFVDNKRIITLEDVRRVCFGDEQATRYLAGPNSPHGQDLGLPNAPHSMYIAYDYPCPKPVAQVIIRCPDLAGQAQWTAGGTLGDGLSARAEKGGTRTGLRAILHRTKNLFVIRGDYSGLTQPIELQLYRHQDTTPQGTSIMGIAHFGGDTGYDYSQDKGNGPIEHPEAGADGRFLWVRQRFPAEKTFPGGFECVTMACIVGPAYTTRADSHVTGAGVKCRVHPLTEAGQREVVGWLKELRIAAERFNNAESGVLATATIPALNAPFTAFIAVVTTRDATDPLAAARKLLSEAVAKGVDGVEADSMAATSQQVRAWNLSRVMHYNATSCTFVDAIPWHGDYHFNEGYLTNQIVAGGSDEIDQRMRMFEEMLPALKRNAREVYGCRGAAFSLVHYPIKTDRVVYSNVVWEWGIENTALMLQPFWQTYQYTQDIDFLRKRAYPMMVEGARFYTDYVKKGDDGFYHVIPTVSQEHWGFTPRWNLNRDSVGALSFVKYQLRACIEASEILGVDAAERERWREIVAHLAPYPTLRTDKGQVFCDVRDAPSLLNYNCTANLIMVLWAEDISRDSPPELLELARRSYEAIPDKEHSMRPGYLAQIAMLLGINKEPDLSPMGRVLSWPGRIHLYAGVPEGVAVNDRFAGLLAVGGFEVSAAHVGTRTCSVRITSRAGKTCRVKSPWPAGEVKVITLPGRQAVAHALVGDTIVFPTKAGETYALLAGDELAMARKRYVPQEKLVGKWACTRLLDGMVPDDSGNGLTAALVGGATVGKEGLTLSGEQAFASVKRQPALDFAADEGFAIEARIKLPLGAPARQIPVVCSMAIKQYCFTVQDGRADLYLSSPTGDVYCSVRGQTFLADGRWHTIRAVRDVSDGTLRVSVDGRQEGVAADLTGGDFRSDAPLTIGAYLWGANSRYARGVIADVTIKSLGRLVDGQ